MRARDTGNGMRIAVIAAALFAIVACGRATLEDPPMDDRIKKSLNDFANRRIYTTLSPQILASISDDKLEQAIFDYAATKLEGHYDDEANIVNKFPSGVRALYVTWEVEAEVNNGGFHQYYWNTADRYSKQAVEGFEFFGAVKHAALMRETNSIRAKEIDALAKFRKEDTSEAFYESSNASQLGPLDERFFGLDENLSVLRVAKIRAMPVVFSGR
jgi:Domain of unknown function (DUF4375)